MTGNKRTMAVGWIDPDDAPDLSTPDYQAKLAATAVRRGRPKAKAPKVRIGFRLSADVVASVRASGHGYNARVEQALRKAGFGIDQALSGLTERNRQEGQSREESETSEEAPHLPRGKGRAGAQKEQGLNRRYGPSPAVAPAFALSRPALPEGPRIPNRGGAHFSPRCDLRPSIRRSMRRRALASQSGAELT